MDKRITKAIDELVERVRLHNSFCAGHYAGRPGDTTESLGMAAVAARTALEEAIEKYADGECEARMSLLVKRRKLVLGYD